MPITVYTDASLIKNSRDLLLKTLEATIGNCRVTAVVILAEDLPNKRSEIDTKQVQIMITTLGLKIVFNNTGEFTNKYRVRLEDAVNFIVSLTLEGLAQQQYAM